VEKMLDFRVAQALHKARQIERALHDPGPWTITYGNHIMPAVRFILDDRVTFWAHFPDACWIKSADRVLTLQCRDEEVGVKPLWSDDEIIPDGESNIEWTFVLPAPVRV
jgi:hypothetical protein